MIFTATINVRKTAGRKQDEQAIQDELQAELDGITSLFVDDGERDGESEYEVDVSALEQK